VNWLSCTARIKANSAKASVIMAKKMAFTRSENAPITNDRTAASAMPTAKPSARWP
jgi:hypothetical protein